MGQGACWHAMQRSCSRRLAPCCLCLAPHVLLHAHGLRESRLTGAGWQTADGSRESGPGRVRCEPDSRLRLPGTHESTLCAGPAARPPPQAVVLRSPTQLTTLTDYTTTTYPTNNLTMQVSSLGRVPAASVGGPTVLLPPQRAAARRTHTRMDAAAPHSPALRQCACATIDHARCCRFS
jgi:hypothetical protein